MVLLAKGEKTLNGMVRDFNGTCEEFEMKINVKKKKTKSMVISKMICTVQSE